jgi:hypothetical protein
MFPKDAWEVGDTVIVNGKHGTIKEFSSDNKKVYVEHKDNENHPYVRWYEVAELPPFGEPTQPIVPFVAGQRVRLLRDLQDGTTYPRPSTLYKGDVGEVSNYMGTLGFRMNGQISFTRVIDGVKCNVLDFCELVEDEAPAPAVAEEAKPEPLPSAAQSDSTPPAAVIVDDLPDDITLLKEIIREQRRKLNNQSISINAMMDAKEDEGIKDKLEQLEDDYATLEKEKATVVSERDKLAEVNRQQCEMLKQANEVMDAFRVVGNFLRLDKVITPKLEQVDVQPT